MAKVYLKKQPTFQIFTTLSYSFTVTAASASLGAVYSNNGQLYTVTTALTGGTSLAMCGTGAPASSGTLTLVSGTGAATIAFSANSPSGGTLTGTYFLPTGIVPSRIRVKMVAGGGGGGGSAGSTLGANASGTTGINSTFGTSLLTCTGGGGASTAANNATPGTAGTASIVAPAFGTLLNGAAGGAGTIYNASSNSINLFGGNGGENPLSGGGSGGKTGADGSVGQPNTGAGGGGGGVGSAVGMTPGAGGGAGGYVDAIIQNPSSSYSFQVGTGGLAGGAGTGGANGGGGAGGIIVVEEYYD